MPHNRFYLPKEFVAHTQVAIAGKEFEHLSRVMRARPGDKVELVNGQGALAQAVVSRLEKREGFFDIESIETEQESTNPMIIAQALPKINRLDLIVEKTTELGCDELWLFAGKKSEKKELTPNQKTRLENILTSSMKQSGRLWLPKIRYVDPILTWKNVPKPAFFGDLDAKSHFLQLFDETKPLFFVVGPEGGLNEREKSHLVKLAANPVQLHPNILRTETASLVVLSQAYGKRCGILP